jgi:hypothetical protein
MDDVDSEMGIGGFHILCPELLVRRNSVMLSAPFLLYHRLGREPTSNDNALGASFAFLVVFKAAAEAAPSEPYGAPAGSLPVWSRACCGKATYVGSNWS